MDNETKYKITYSIMSKKGNRPTMEDTYVFISEFLKNQHWYFGAVFDGHGGKKASEYAVDNFHNYFGKLLLQYIDPIIAFNKAFNTLDEDLTKFDGGTTVASFLIKENQITLSNIGDSRIAIITNNGFDYFSPQHRISNKDEFKRVIDSGAIITGPYVTLKDGRGLMTTRTLGNHEFRKIGIISKPSIRSKKVRINQNILVATDGLWDSISLESIQNIIIEENVPEIALKNLFHIAQPRDNFTAILVKVN